MRNRQPKTTPVAPGTAYHFDGHDLYLIVNGVKVAKRGHPNTPEARTWISLDPRFEAHSEGWSYRSVRGLQ
jgi:hypothetical protein